MSKENESCQCCGTDNSPYAELDSYFQEMASHPGSLITVLQTVQERYGYLPVEAMLRISKIMGVRLAKIYGVATFYAQFRLEPVGKYLLMLCKGTACHVNGSDTIAEALVDLLGIHDGETTEDGLFTIKEVACLGCCSLAPVMMVQSAEKEEVFGNLTRDAIPGIIAELRSREEGGAKA